MLIYYKFLDVCRFEDLFLLHCILYSYLSFILELSNLYCVNLWVVQ